MRSLKDRIQKSLKVSLYSNAFYLMASAGLSAPLSVFFLMAVARLYGDDKEDLVGQGTALMQAAALLAFIGTLGFGFALIRYLPGSGDKASRILNSSLTISMLTSIVIAVIFLCGTSLWTPDLAFTRDNAAYMISFVLFVILATLTPILEQAFIALRRAKYVLISRTTGILLRLAIIVAFAWAGTPGAFHIFAAWGIGLALAVTLCLLLFLPRSLAGYRPKPDLDIKSSKEMIRYAFGSYIAEGLQYAPVWILPLMVLGVLGSDAQAYFYMSWMMGALLLRITEGVSLSLFAEGSYDEEPIRENLIRSIKLIAFFIMPLILATAIIGDKILLIFGREYSEQGATLIRLLALATIPACVTYLYMGVARVEKKLGRIIMITGTISLSTLLISYLLLHHLDSTTGVGIAWLASNVVVALLVLPAVIKRLQSDMTPQSQL